MERVAQMSRSKLGAQEKSLWHQSLAVLHLLNVNFGLDRGEKWKPADLSHWPTKRG